MTGRWKVIGGGGAAGVAGAPGAPGAGGTPTAPDLVSATAAPSFSMESNVTAFTFSGGITVNDAAGSWTNTDIISVVAYGPSALNGQEIARLHKPFTVVAHVVSYSGEAGAFLQSTGATSEIWALRFTAYDLVGVPSATPVNVTGISVAPASVAATITAAELPRFQDPNQGLQNRVTTTITTGGAQVPMNVTFWLSRDNGATKRLQGWTKITTSPATLTLPYPKEQDSNGEFDGYYVPTDAAETWIVYAAAGPLLDLTPPAVAVACTPFVVGLPAALTASTITGAKVLGLAYARKPGGFTWAWTGFQCTCPLVTSGPVTFLPEFWFGRFYLAKGAWNPGTQTWTPDPNYPEWAIGDTEDGTETVSVNLVTTIASPPQDFPDTADPFPTFRVRIAVFTRTFGDPGTAVNAWTGAEPTGVVNATSGAAAYITPDQTKAVVNASPAAFAPALTTVSVPTVNFVTEGGLPKWNLSGTVTLPASFTGIKWVLLTIKGLPDILSIANTQFGVAPFTLAGLVMSYVTPNFPRDSATHAYTVAAGSPLQVWTENADGVLTGPINVDVTVTGTAPPFSGLNPPAPNLTAVTMVYSLIQVNGAPMFTASGNITFPEDTSQILQIDFYFPLFGILTFSLPRPAAGWPASPSPMPYVIGTFDQSLLPQSYPWHVEVENLDNKQTGGGPSGTLSVAAASGNFTPPPGVIAISTVTVSEGIPRKRQTNLDTTATLTVTVALAANYGTQNFTAWYSDDGGATFLWTNWYPISGASGSFTIQKIAPLSPRSVVVALVPGAIPGDPGTAIASAALDALYPRAPSVPAVQVRSSGFSLQGRASPLSSAILSALMGTVAAAADLNGQQRWSLSDTTITDLQPVGDPNAKHTLLWVYVCNGSNTPPTAGQPMPTSGSGRATQVDGGLNILVANFDVDGTVHHVFATGVNGWGYPADQAMDRARFVIEVINENGLGSVQSCWGGADATHPTCGDAIFGTIPTGAINAARIRPTSLGPGILPDPVTGKPGTGNPNPSTSLLNDWDFRYSGIIPSSAWFSSGGVSVTISASGGIDGGPYATIHAAVSGNNYLQQSFACAPNQPLYFQVATRNGTLSLTADFYDISNITLVSRVTVGTVLASGSWVAAGISGTILASSIPSNAAFCRLSLIQISGSCDVTMVIAQQVVQNINSGQTTTNAPIVVGGDTSAVRTVGPGGADLSSSAYGKNQWQMVATDGLAKLSALVATFQASITGTIGSGGGLNLFSISASTGTTTFSITRNGAIFTGFDGTLASAVSLGKTVKMGVIVN